MLLSKDITLGAQMYSDHNADAIVAVGGGSGLDAGKCIAMAAASGGSVPLKNFEKGHSDLLFYRGNLEEQNLLSKIIAVYCFLNNFTHQI